MERALLRHTYVRTNEPVRFRGNMEGRMPLRARHHDGEKDLAEVGIGHHQTFLQANWHRPCNRGGFGTLRQAQVEFWWFSGRAGIDPIDMPAFGQLEMQTELERLCRIDRVDIRGERHARMRRYDRLAFKRPRRRRGTERESKRAKKP